VISGRIEVNAKFQDIALIGGFNDHRMMAFHEGNKRERLTVTIPRSMREANKVEFQRTSDTDFEVYRLEKIQLGGKFYEFYVHSTLSTWEAFDRLLKFYGSKK
jgi:hypothetical protein